MVNQIMPSPHVPAVITSSIENAHLVRNVANEMKIRYREEVLEGCAIRFYFETRDSAQSNALALAVPREAYLYRGVIGGE